MAQISEFQLHAIAHRRVTGGAGGSVAALARDYGMTEIAMRRLLASRPVREISARYRDECRAVVENARHWLESNAHGVARQLIRDATSDDPKVRAVALPLALKHVFGDPGTSVSVSHSGRLEHVTSDADAPLSPIVVALRESLAALAERQPVIDITKSTQVLSGEAARPRPPGWEDGERASRGAVPVFAAPSLPRSTLPSADD